MDLGSVSESELGQKWRYGALKACHDDTLSKIFVLICKVFLFQGCTFERVLLYCSCLC